MYTPKKKICHFSCNETNMEQSHILARNHITLWVINACAVSYEVTKNMGQNHIHILYTQLMAFGRSYTSTTIFVTIYIYIVYVCE